MKKFILTCMALIVLSVCYKSASAQNVVSTLDSAAIKALKEKAAAANSVKQYQQVDFMKANKERRASMNFYSFGSFTTENVLGQLKKQIRELQFKWGDLTFNPPFNLRGTFFQ